MKHYKIIVARIAFVSATVLLATAAMAASPPSTTPPVPPKEVVAMQYGYPVARPLYTPQCVYKTVMSDLDMRRCGVFLYGGPLAVTTVKPVNRGANRVYR